MLFDQRMEHESDTVVRTIFDEMPIESVQNYVQLFRMLPLELINPAVLLPYLPCGKQTPSNFFKRVKQLVAPDVYRDIFVNDASNLFESLAVEYCFELG